MHRCVSSLSRGIFNAPRVSLAYEFRCTWLSNFLSVRLSSRISTHIGTITELNGRFKNNNFSPFLNPRPPLLCKHNSFPSLLLFLFLSFHTKLQKTQTLLSSSSAVIYFVKLNIINTSWVENNTVKLKNFKCYKLKVST